MKKILFWIFCIVALVFWKFLFSTDAAEQVFDAAMTPSQSQTPVPIEQIEDIAQKIATQSNANKQDLLNDMTIAFNAVAVGSNVRFEAVIRVKKGLTPKKIEQWLHATRKIIIPKTCAINMNSPVFNHGLSYTFAYSNPYGKKLGEVHVDQTVCENYTP